MVVTYLHDDDLHVHVCPPWLHFFYFTFLLLGPIFGHTATTKGGSSGCPVFREFEGRLIVVGLHRAELPLPSDKTIILTNLATRMSAIFEVYMGMPYKGPGMSFESVTMYGCSAASFLLHVYTTPDEIFHVILYQLLAQQYAYFMVITVFILQFLI